MAGSVSGSVRLSVSVKTTTTSGANAASSASVTGNDAVAYAAGSGAGQLNRIYSFAGSAAAAPAAFDLTAVVTADGQVGFSHWRELIVYNDDPVNPLTWDFTVANANTAMFAAGGTAAKIAVPPGGLQRFTKPLGANGNVVDATHKAVSLDPGANTVAFRFDAFGD